MRLYDSPGCTKLSGRPCAALGWKALVYSNWLKAKQISKHSVFNSMTLNTSHPDSISCLAFNMFRKWWQNVFRKKCLIPKHSFKQCMLNERVNKSGPVGATEICGLVLKFSSGTQKARDSIPYKSWFCTLS